MSTGTLRFAPAAHHGLIDGFAYGVDGHVQFVNLPNDCRGRLDSDFTDQFHICSGPFTTAKVIEALKALGAKEYTGDESGVLDKGSINAADFGGVYTYVQPGSQDGFDEELVSEPESEPEGDSDDSQDAEKQVEEAGADAEAEPAQEASDAAEPVADAADAIDDALGSGVQSEEAAPEAPAPADAATSVKGKSK